MNTKIFTFIISILFPILSFGNKTTLVVESETNCISFVFIPSNYNGQTISCPNGNDGSLAVNAFGGIPPYSYLWDNGSTSFQRNNLGAGTYSVTVTDLNGCSLNSSLSLQAPDAISISKSIINGVKCINSSDGILAVSAAGGTPPYSYNWDTGHQSPVADAISCGFHTVSVTDANGCMTSTLFALECPNVMQVDVTPTSDYGGFNISCPESEDGAASVSIQFGQAPYYYQWSSGASTSNPSDLKGGINSLTVTDSYGCSVISFVDLSTPSSMELHPNITSNFEGYGVSCENAEDGEVLLDVTNGAAPYTYSWENGSTQALGTNLPAGATGVTVTDVNGCSVETSVELTAYEITIVPEIISNLNGSPISCKGASDGVLQMNVTAGASSPPNVTYLWNNNHDEPLLENVPAGTYALTVTSAFGCTASAISTIEEPSSVEVSTAVISDYNGYNISIHGSNNGIAEVLPSGGIEPYSVSWGNGISTLTNTQLSAGTQSVIITDVNGCTIETEIMLTEPTPLEGFADILSDFNGQDISCYDGEDGEATVFASGAVPPYTYNWSNNTSGESTQELSKGIHQVTITDQNGATIVSEITISEPEPITLEMKSTPASNPPNGTASAIAYGGTAPYTFSWNDPYSRIGAEVDLLKEGWYRVTVTDANGCTTLDQVEVKQSNEIDCIKENMTITPNGDGKNDFLTLGCIQPFNNDVEIYDRYGNLIFQAVNYDGTWSGLNQNKKVPDGGYFYIIRVALPTGKRSFKGSLTIIR